MVRVNFKVSYIKYFIFIIILGRLSNKYINIFFKYYINAGIINIKVVVEFIYIKIINYNNIANKERLS